MLTVGVLGEVEARRDGDRLPLPAGKTAELLARLAVDPGVRVRTDALLEDLWGGPAARNTLQAKVSRLRHALGDKSLVVGSADGYLLAVPPEAVDAMRAVALATASATARAEGRTAESLDRAREGLELFRGEVLAEAGDWAETHRVRLEEVRLGLLEDALAARVDLGSGGEVVGELETLVATHPLREGLWACLITALYRSGRQADALAAYARVRRLLVDELGVEPGPALRQLEHRVLRQSPDLGTPVRAALRPGNLPGNLPGRARPMVGREADLAAVTQALAGHPLVTVVGPAGVGKTRLALEVGRVLEAPGGVWLVRLDSVDAAEATARLGQVVAEAMHVVGGAAALAERLSGADTVVVLDTCEHLASEVADLVGPLLDAVPGLRVLATSQVRLGLEAEHVHDLAPLTQDASVELFVRRAQELRRSFVLDDETADVVAHVCRSLDGLPLALELAATRVRSLSVREISRRLGDRFALLRDPTSPRRGRSRALEDAIAWSYELLFPDDQRTLMALSCFAAGAPLAALEQVLAVLDVPAAAVLDTVGRLEARSLLAVEDAEGGEVRYRLLDSIRVFAGARLGESGRAEAFAAAHAGWYAATADWCDEQVRGSRQPACLTVVRAERADVDAALSWSAAHAPALGLRIANGFGWAWVVAGDGTAGAARLRAALYDGAPPPDRARALLVAGWLEASTGDVALAQADLDDARVLAADLGDEEVLADVERHQAFLAIQQGRPDAVLASARASLTVYRSRRLDWSAAASLELAAYGSLMVGDAEAARHDATEALHLLGPIGDAWGIVHAEAMLGGIARAEHRLTDAARALERAADTSAAMGFVGQAALHRATLARVQHRLDDPAAPASYERALDDCRTVGDGRLAATVRLDLARWLRAHGDAERALRLLEMNERWYRAAGGGDFALLSACVLASMRDDEPWVAEVLTLARDQANATVQVVALDALARLAGVRGDIGAAATLLAESDDLAQNAGHLLDEADRLDAVLARDAQRGE